MVITSASLNSSDAAAWTVMRQGDEYPTRIDEALAWKVLAGRRQGGVSEPVLDLTVAMCPRSARRSMKDAATLSIVRENASDFGRGFGGRHQPGAIGSKDCHRRNPVSLERDRPSQRTARPRVSASVRNVHGEPVGVHICCQSPVASLQLTSETSRSRRHRRPETIVSTCRSDYCSEPTLEGWLCSVK